MVSFDMNDVAVNPSAVVTIRTMYDDDAAAVLAIYQQGIDTGHATFQDVAPDWQTWSNGHLSECRLVAELDGRVAGWCALSAVSSRCVYRGVAEESIYIAAGARGRGVGKQLLQALVDASEQAGLWTLQTGIFPENRASITLHEQVGFRVLGIRERIGLMSYGPLAGIWRDVAFMERRSSISGC
jgi:phosphinothricin acetyltransferase